MQNAVDTRRCPICGGDNGCTMAAGTRDPNTPCWCVGVRFSARTLARVPREWVDKACICKVCARGDVNDPALHSPHQDTA